MDEELLDNFAAFFACKKYYKVNKLYPERILIYPDGVRDGQLPYVFKHKLENIKKTISKNLQK